MNLKRLMLRLFLTTVACCAIAFAADAQTVNKVFKNQSLKSVLKEIESQTGLSVICNSDNLNDHAPVSATFENTPVEQVLATVLGDRFEFSIVNKMIVIRERKNTPPQRAGAPAGSVTGVVKDQYGHPLPGASVVVKNSGKGTTTDSEGRFTLTGATSSDVLQAMFLGYKNEEQPVGNRTEFSFTLADDTQQIEELVVVGYGVQKRSDITGSVTSVKAKELVSAPTFNTSQALQGRVAGVMVQNSSGSPSAAPEIRIRGANSLLYGNSPLVIVDGVQGVGLNSLNPNEIESMEVLKDAAALSIYGSRGANGVILVTTKKGDGERARVTYNGFVSVDKVRRLLPALEAKEYATLFDEFRKESGLSEYFGPEAIATLGKGTNWQDKIYRTAISHNHNLSLGGAKKDISYFVAANVSQREGIILNTNYDQYTLRGNINAKATPRLDLGLNIFAVYDENKRGSAEGAIPDALQWSPTVAVYDPDSPGGYSQPQPNGIGPVLGTNPVGAAKELIQESFSGGFHASLKVDYRLWDFLKASNQLSYQFGSTTNGYFDNQVVRNGPSKDVEGSKTVSNNNSIRNTTMLAFDREWAGHHVQATGVYEVYKSVYNAVYGSSTGIPVKMGYQGIGFGTRFAAPGSDYGKSASQSVMGRVNYSYENRYMLSGSVRYDGASQLAEGHKFDTFWAVSAGWNLMQEKFMEPVKPVLSEFKLRASYGTVGNAAVPSYSSLLLLNSNYDSENDQLILGIKQVANSDLRWERTREFNAGFDATLWEGRLVLTVEYYDKKTTDLLMWQKVPVVSNVDQVLRNVGSVSNKGWDFSIGGTPFSTRDFSWSINYTLNLNRNRILELDGINSTLIGTQLDYPGMVGSHIQRIGEPMATYLGYTFAGTWKTDEASTAAMYGFEPGDAKYVDVNRDGKIDQEDITIIGNAQPKGVYGINNTFRWKNLDLNIFFQGVWGNDIYNVNRVRRETYGDQFGTDPVVRNHWTPENQTEYPAFTGKEYKNSSRWVEDGSYLRLKNLSLGYRLPSKWMTKIGISSLRVYASASNLWTITDYSGYDPESSNGMDANGGVDYGVYPSIKSFVFGVDLTF